MNEKNNRNGKPRLKPEERKAIREENTKKRMEENRKIGTLSDRQHNALAFLCAVRHQMHARQKAFFLSNDPKHAEFELLLGKDGNGTINRVLQDAGLPTIEINEDIFKVQTDECFKRGDYDSEYAFELSRARAFDKSDKLAEKINKQIENYLFVIDKEHGTKYRPFGAYRFPKESHVHAVQVKYRDQAFNRVNEAIKAAVIDMTNAGISVSEVWQKLQGYMDKNYSKDLFVVSISPAGLIKPPVEIARALNITNSQLIEIYQKIEHDISEITSGSITVMGTEPQKGHNIPAKKHHDIDI